MNTRFLGIAVALFFVLAMFQDSFAETLVTSDAVKIQDLTSTSDGVEFAVKAKKIIATNASCKNHFIVPSTAEEYDTQAAFLLAAFIKHKKISFVFDNDSTDCTVEVQSITLN